MIRNIAFTLGIFGIIIIVIMSGCVDKNRIKIKKEYYRSGKLKSYGKYIDDSLPIDTIFHFFENGKLFSKEIFNKKSDLLIAFKYFENGNTNEIINYKDGLANNFLYQYYENGKLKSKVFYFNDNQVGDRYLYDDKGKLLAYNFINWKPQGVNYLKYDSLGNIIKDVRQKIFLDSLKPYHDSTNKENENSYDLLLIVSNPPHCSTQIKINFLSEHGISMGTDTLFDKQYYFKNERLPDSLYKIKIIGSQYDSVQKKVTYQKLAYDIR